MGPHAGVDYNLNLCPLQSRLQHIYHGQPNARVDLNRSYARIDFTPPVRVFGFGLDTLSRLFVTVCTPLNAAYEDWNIQYLGTWLKDTDSSHRKARKYSNPSTSWNRKYSSVQFTKMTFFLDSLFEKAIPGLYPRPAGEASGCAQHLPWGKKKHLKGQWRNNSLTSWQNWLTSWKHWFLPPGSTDSKHLNSTVAC
jgi:hypothetical protein